MDWTSGLVHKYVIYCKNPKNHGKYDVDLPNYGFDTIVYLKYIVDNYDNLPDYCCFSQDDPFDHCGGFLRHVNEFKGDSEFAPLGRVYKRDNKTILDQIKRDAKMADIEYIEPILFISGAQCIVSKSRILMRARSYYADLMSHFPVNKIISNYNYTLEYLWPQILSSQHDLTPQNR